MSVNKLWRIRCRSGGGWTAGFGEFRARAHHLAARKMSLNEGLKHISHADSWQTCPGRTTTKAHWSLTGLFGR